MTVFAVIRHHLFRLFLLAGVLAQGLPGARAEGHVELTDKQKSVLASILRGPVSGRWSDLTTNQLAELRQRADAYLSECRKHHLPGGLVASIRYSDTNQSQVVSYEALDQSAAWTGFYITGLTFRYAVTRDTRNLNDLRNALDGVLQLLSASGRTGYVARFVGRADDPAYRAAYANFGGADAARSGFGKWAYPGKGAASQLVWLGNSTRENYAGLNLGLGTAYQLIRDAQVREKVALCINRILDRLIEDDWKIDDGQGNTTFVTPILRTALLRTGATVSPAKYLSMYEVRVKDARELQELAAPGISRYGDYNGGVFSFANCLSVARLETNQTRRLVFQSKCSDLWRDCGPHLNAWFAAAYVSAFDSILDPVVRATLQGQLYQFPAPPRWSVRRDHTTRTNLPIIEANGIRWSKFALPLSEQGSSPFQWSQSPFALSGGSDELVVHPGIDFFLPFWMGREGGLIPSEDEPPPITPQFKSFQSRSTNAPARGTNTPARRQP